MKKQIRVKLIFTSIIAAMFIIAGFAFSDEEEQNKPNIVILMSDNHSWNHLGCYGDPVVKTPNIDKIAQQGIKFTNAFCSAPSCTPARASMLTGQNIWRLEEGANLWGTLPSKFKVYTEMLEEAGYLVGFEGKGWGPGSFEAGGRDRNPAGEQFNSIEEFFSKRKKGQPFTYWFSSRNPHRPYSANAKEQPIDLASIEVPAYLPDNNLVRRDIADYYAEIQTFDKEVGTFMQYLEESGEMENTIVIVCSDNGWQMPRGLANLYEFGIKVPMIIKCLEIIRKVGLLMIL
jgi:N-sulfoglucosamine sulfohydrolase